MYDSNLLCVHKVIVFFSTTFTFTVTFTRVGHIHSQLNARYLVHCMLRSDWSGRKTMGSQLPCGMLQAAFFIDDLAIFVACFAWALISVSTWLLGAVLSQQQ